MSNAPTEIELLRQVASAAAWAIESNGDDPVGKDGRARVGINWVMANGQLNRALSALREHYPIADQHSEQRAEAAVLAAQLKRKK